MITVRFLPKFDRLAEPRGISIGGEIDILGLFLQARLPVIRLAMPVAYCSYDNFLAANDVRNETWEDGTVNSTVAAFSLSPQHRIFDNPADNVRHFAPQPFTQPWLLRLVSRGRFDQLLPGILQEFDRHFVRLRSKSEKTSPAGRERALP